MVLAVAAFVDGDWWLALPLTLVAVTVGGITRRGGVVPSVGPVDPPAGA